MDFPFNVRRVVLKDKATLLLQFVCIFELCTIKSGFHVVYAGLDSV